MSDILVWTPAVCSELQLFLSWIKGNKFGAEGECAIGDRRVFHLTSRDASVSDVGCTLMNQILSMIPYIEVA